VRHVFGRFAKDVARGLRIRCDWGRQIQSFSMTTSINSSRFLMIRMTGERLVSLR